MYNKEFSIVESSSTVVTTNKLQQKEMPIYGSSRIGLQRFSDRVLEHIETTEGPGGLVNSQVFPISPTFPSSTRGSKYFEISNHLGNVLSVFSDQKLGIGNGSSIVEYYEANTVSASDYYPFGLQMPERTFSSPEYRYGFNGKEKDEGGEWGELTHYDYGFRIYNPGIARFLSTDPLFKTYAELTPYQFASNTPIAAIDLDGLEAHPIYYAPRWFRTAFNFYAKYENYIHGYGKMGKGLVLQATGTSLVSAGAAGTATIFGAPVGAGAIAVGSSSFVYGSSEFAYGLAMVKDEYNSTEDPRIAAADNSFQYIGNEIDRKFGTSSAGDIGFYTGETISLVSGTLRGIQTIKNFGESGINAYQVTKLYLAYAKVISAPGKAIDLSTRAIYDYFAVDPKARLSRLTSFTQKIEFLEDVINIEILYTDEEYNQHIQQITIENQIGMDEANQKIFEQELESNLELFLIDNGCSEQCEQGDDKK